METSPKNLCGFIISSPKSAHLVTQELKETVAQDGEKNAVTRFVTLLRACTKHKDLPQGLRLHDAVLKRGLLDVCSDALVTMYAKCGAINEAKALFHTYKSKDILTWTAIIAGFAQKGQGHKALDFYECMRQEDLFPDIVTFTCILKACGITRALNKGEQIHDEIAREGWLEKDIVLGNALVDMYVKCGVLTQALRLLEELHMRNVITWNTLIVGYAQQSNAEQALDCLERMQHEGLSPDAVTFSCALKACGSIRALDKGEQLHDEIAKRGLLGIDRAVSNALVDMYAKCGALGKARKVLEKLHIRDVTTWTALISGYAEHGHGGQALKCVELMQDEGVSPNAVTFLCLLKASGCIRAATHGEKIYAKIVKQGLLGSDTALGNALVGMYVKCGAIRKAQQVLEELPIWDVVAWNSVIAGYAEEGEGEQALNCFERMQGEGLTPDAVTFSCILRGCGCIGAKDKGQKIHHEIAKQGLLGNNPALGNALVEMYAKCGVLEKAREVLDDLLFRDVISWNVLIAGYVQWGVGEQALDCFEEMQSEGLSPDAVTFIYVLKACGSIGAGEDGEEIYHDIDDRGLLGSHVELGTAVVDMYVKVGNLAKARDVLRKLRDRNVVCWSSLIAGYAQRGECEEAINCFEEMQREGLSPDKLTFVFLLQACGSMEAIDKGQDIHNEIVEQRLLENDTMVGNALVDMYAKCGTLNKAHQVLKELPVRDAITWNALITGYAQEGRADQALNCFEAMLSEGLSADPVTCLSILKACGGAGMADKGEKLHDEVAKRYLVANDVVLGNALVDMYVKCGELVKARQVLEQLHVRDIVSWNTIISGYVQWCQGVQALDCFERMQRDGLYPDVVTFLSLVKACGITGALDKGEKVHHEIAKRGLLDNNMELGNALVDMYAKSGALVRAQQLLETLPVQDLISWNSLIAGHAQWCEGAKALSCFEQMHGVGLSPDASTFSCVLSACSRSGLVEDARRLFMEMLSKYGISPSLEHYTCVVDLFGRTGYLNRAVEVIEKVPPLNKGVWSALLGACKKWGDVGVGRWAFEHALQVDKMDGGVYVLMASIYAAAGMQEDAESIESMRKENKAWKEKLHDDNGSIHSMLEVEYVAGAHV